MNKKPLMLSLLSSLLFAPFVLAHEVKAEEAVDQASATLVKESQAEAGQAQDDSQASAAPVLYAGTIASNQDQAIDLSTATEATPPSETNASPTPVLAKAETGTNYETAEKLLKEAVADPSLLGSSENDVKELAKSLGMVAEKDTKWDQAPSAADYKKMLEVADKVKEATHAKTKEPLFLNGKAQPIFPYTTGAVKEGYSNEVSDIVRFTVYVETDYDTDGDGKRDLVKTLVQVPKAAINGDFKAATIFEARPYITGTTEMYRLSDMGLKEGGSYELNNLYSQPEKRQALSTTTSKEHAKKADSKEWYYESPYEGTMAYEDLNWYDYFLVRGFAVVQAAGLGSKGSEGFNTTGSDLEIAAFKNIVEWINGKRVAYTDKENNVAIKADWANGNVGMTGLSWAGTSTFGVATTGVEGLKTIVPAAGIASWYEYLNSQGSPFENSPYKDLSWLSIYVMGRILDGDDWDSIKEKYADYISQLNKEQDATFGDYSEIWKKRDYTLDAAKIKTPALIVHGLNDDNVKTKHLEMMLEAVEKAGQNAKLYLHQGNHIYPAKFTKGFGLAANGESFYELLNKWFSHYLYGLDNGIEKAPKVLSQDNYDPTKWHAFESWKSSKSLEIKGPDEDKEVTLTSDYEKSGVNWAYRDRDIAKGSTGSNITIFKEVDEEMIIKGKIPVHFKAALAKGEGKNLQINAVLLDVSDQEFDVVNENVTYDEYYAKYRNLPLKMVKEKGFWIGSGVENLDLKEFETSKVTYKKIASGWVNLRNPNSGWESASSAESIDPKVGDYHDYTVYLNPNVYRVAKGHRLALVLTMFDTNQQWVYEDYDISFKLDSIQATLPIAGPADYVKEDLLDPSTFDQNKLRGQNKAQESGQVEVLQVAAPTYAAPAKVLPQTGDQGSVLLGLGLVGLTLSVSLVWRKEN